MFEYLFPTLCISCTNELEKNVKIFCKECQENLALINPQSRCSKCFLDLGCACKKRDNPIEATASALDYNETSSCLIRKLKYGGAFYLAKGGASFMAMQYLHLNWEKPNLITWVPLTFLRFMMRGYNQSQLLANNLSKILNVKCATLLKKKGFSPPQASLDLEERMKAAPNFTLKNENLDLTGKTVLLIDDVMTTGSTLHHAAIALLDANPLKIYALTLCRTNLELD